MLYNLLLFLHIIGALGMGAAIFFEITGQTRIRRAQTVEQVRDWLAAMVRLGPVFGVASLLLLVPGIIMTFMQWGWGTGWIDLSLLAALILMIWGPAFNGRRGAALQKIADAAGSGPVTPALREQYRDSALWVSSMTTGAAVLGIVLLMTLKPGFPGAVLVLVVALALGFGVAQLTKGAGRDAAPAVASDAGA